MDNDNNVIPQSNPCRVKSSWSRYCGRIYRRKVNGIWMYVTCGCCYSDDARIRHYQNGTKYLPKTKTLRTHRIGK